MFGISKKTQEKFSYNQAVILELSYHQDYLPGTNKFLDAMKHLEEAITPALPANAGIDGHDISDTEVIVYIYGDSAQAIWEHIESILQKSDFTNIDVTLQYGDPRDKNTQDKQFTVN